MRGSNLLALVIVCVASFHAERAIHASGYVAMAPPVAVAGPENGAKIRSASVFMWNDIPKNRQTLIMRASFDAGGYQLYDTAGETIIAPFAGKNLFVLKFGISNSGSMRFINTGSAPILYMPRNGYLENAAVPGARWYPFARNFSYSEPVYIGIAPNWDAFAGMGWYAGMCCHGGYGGRSTFRVETLAPPTGEFVVTIGVHRFYGWDQYRSYMISHPGWRRAGYYRRDYYRWASHPSLSRPPFGSVAHPSRFQPGADGKSHLFFGGSPMKMRAFRGVSNNISGLHGIRSSVPGYRGADKRGHEFRGNARNSSGSHRAFLGAGNHSRENQKHRL